MKVENFSGKRIAVRFSVLSLSGGGFNRCRIAELFA
jgi:hypothetical protein